jgi:hypothetical protein
MLIPPPVLEFSPYHLSLLGLVLTMSLQGLSVFLAWRQWLAAAVLGHSPWRTPWLPLGLGILFLLRQSWGALEFSLFTGVYDVAAVSYQLLAAFCLLLAVSGFSAGQRR